MLNIWGQSEYYNAWRNTDVKDGGIGQVGYTLVANKWGQSLMNPHEIMNKTCQKQQLNKIYINTRIKPCLCEGIK